MATWTFTQRVQVQCCFMSTETIRTIKDEDPRTATWTFTQRVQVQCCFMSTETIRTIKDREPRTATSTFTQVLSSEPALVAGRFYLALFSGPEQTRCVLVACDSEGVTVGFYGAFFNGHPRGALTTLFGCCT